MGCLPDEVMAQERAVLDGLHPTDSWWRDATDLVLYDAQGTELLRYLALEPRIWVPVWSDQEPVPEVRSRIRFSKGTFWGEGPCNHLFGEYTQAGSALVIGTGSTMVSCGDAMDALEATFLDELGATRGYTIDPGVLVLLDESGTELRRFTEAGR